MVGVRVNVRCSCECNDVRSSSSHEPPWWCEVECAVFGARKSVTKSQIDAEYSNMLSKFAIMILLSSVISLQMQLFIQPA